MKTPHVDAAEKLQKAKINYSDRYDISGCNLGIGKYLTYRFFYESARPAAILLSLAIERFIL